MPRLSILAILAACAPALPVAGDLVPHPDPADPSLPWAGCVVVEATALHPDGGDPLAVDAVGERVRTVYDDAERAVLTEVWAHGWVDGAPPTGVEERVYRDGRMIRRVGTRFEGATYRGEDDRFDDRGQLAERTTFVGAGPSRTDDVHTAYAYDARGRLVALATDPDLDGVAEEQWRWRYTDVDDEDGGRLETAETWPPDALEPSDVAIRRYDPAGRLVLEEVPAFTWSDATLSVEAVPLTRETWSYDGDRVVERQVQSLDVELDTLALCARDTWRYDPAGLLVGTTSAYTRSGPCGVLDGQRETTWTRDGEGRITGRVTRTRTDVGWTVESETQVVHHPTAALPDDVDLVAVVPRSADPVYVVVEHRGPLGEELARATHRFDLDGRRVTTIDRWTRDAYRRLQRHAQWQLRDFTRPGDLARLVPVLTTTVTATCEG